MGSFFHGWRRKAGFVTLLMACVFAAGWVRSLSGYDGILWPSGTGRVFGLISTDQHFVCGVRDSVFSNEPLGFPRWRRLDFRSVNKWVDEIPDKSWQFRQGNFAVIQTKNENSTLCFVPCWSIVIPLTTISAWLLSSKSRPAKPPAIETAE
jgi:hypothetical protein